MEKYTKYLILKIFINTQGILSLAPLKIFPIFKQNYPLIVIFWRSSFMSLVVLLWLPSGPKSNQNIYLSWSFSLWQTTGSLMVSESVNKVDKDTNVVFLRACLSIEWNIQQHSAFWPQLVKKLTASWTAKIASKHDRNNEMCGFEARGITLKEINDNVSFAVIIF